MTPGLDGAPVPGVEGFDRVGRADHPPDFHVVVQERDELLPGVIQSRTIAPYFRPQRSVSFSNAALAAAALTAVYMGLTSRLSASQSFFEASRKMFRIKWIMHVWTVVSGHTFPTTSGRPLSPSQDQKEGVLSPRDS